MSIDTFPEFSEIDLSHRTQVIDLLKKYPLEASEYTFTNMFAFRSTYNFKLSLLRDNLIILKDEEPLSVFCPVGNSNMPAVLDDLFDWMKDRTSDPCLERVPESFVSRYLENSDRFIAREERDHFDYVYDVKKMIELKGRSFHDKRNKVNKFRSLYEYEYLEITPDLVDECLEFEDDWCEVKECEKYYGLEKERCAILQMLFNFDNLKIRGGAIRIAGRIEALTLGESMPNDTFVIHVEKANTDIPGLYQIINQEFLIHEAGDNLFVNREQDLGMEGLRRSKMSYNPLKLIRKFRVTMK